MVYFCVLYGKCEIRNFNEVEKMKKFIKVISMGLCLFIIGGCAAGKLSDIYKEEELKKEAEEVIERLNNKDYDVILNEASDELKIALPDNKLKETWEEFSKEIGKFESIAELTCAEKNGYGVVIANTIYANKKVTFTLSFNKDMKLAGINIK